MNDAQKEKYYKKIIYTGSLFYVLTIVLLYFIFGFSFYQSSKIEPIPFNRSIWIEGSEKEVGKQHFRFAMIDDVMKNHLKKGMSKEDVDHLLGEPDDKSDTHYFYLLGSNGGMFGVSFLYIYFDSRNEIEKIDIRHD